MIDSTVIAAIIGAIATIVAAVAAALIAARLGRTRSGRHGGSEGKPGDPPASADVQTIPLSPTLEDALALAENQARRDGRPRTSTRHLFAAIRRLDPDGLKDMLRTLADDDALPEPIEPYDNQAVLTLMYDRPFSHCVTESLTELAHAAQHGEALTIPDVFVDIAKYGHGRSVDRLRNHGYDADRIDELAVAHKVPVHLRRGPATSQ